VTIARGQLGTMLAATVALAGLVVTWTPRPAFAQAASTASLGADAGGDVDALQAALDRDYAQAMANDCALACRALESMRRSAERLCQLDPGDRCARARSKVDAATTRVRTSCPTCPEQLDVNQSTGRKSPDEAPQPSAGTTAYAPAAEEVSVSKRGGCAGCTSAPAPREAFEPLALAAVALAAGRRLRRRSHFGGPRR
jgi:MYXO-CTERM domain-containing protein